ncbi:unnamed protein product [Arctia plantaginis]|uniref:Ubinuclein-1 n=1 Tax=Arctia plantaginis TaxID=874455 RepID=A0A8S0YZB6_ARCPL|nr:unnamed protein product [Arctia plantaginis]
MSDPKRATLITVGATKCAKNNVNKTVRLTINLDESNESKYPELNYKELVIAEERKKREKAENGKTGGLDPFSESNDDVERIARKFEQKYGGKSTYGRKGRSKHDDFADIGAGYDENDSFIDNTHGYDEMIPPECDTLYGGFYINCGSLEFKNVPEGQLAISDAERVGNSRNKRRISSSSSSEESSESSSESSHDEKETAEKPMVNGHLDSHDIQHRKKKNKKVDKQKAKKIRRTDSSAATSGKQTSDDNVQGDGESVDSHSRTSQSDSLASKPAPSSENEATLDNFGDPDVKLPPQVVQALEALENFVERQLAETPNMSSKELKTKSSEYICRMSLSLEACGCAEGVRRAAWARGARALRTSRAQLRLAHAYPAPTDPPHHSQTSTTNAQPNTDTSITSANLTTTTVAPTTTVSTTSVSSSSSKRKSEDTLEDFDPEHLSFDEREAIIVDTLRRLKELIDERKPAMIANYNAECERVQEERKKIQSSAAPGAPVAEKRLPKRRFPWCGRSRALVCRLARAAGSSAAAAALLQRRALPLFPQGFLRMPTLLRQADLSKEIKASDLKRQRLGSASQPPTNPPSVPFSEPIQFPSSLTVTTTTTTKPSQDKSEVAQSTEEKYKSSSVFGSILNTLSLSKDLIIEKPEKKDTHEKKEELYIPPNNIGNITITPVPPNPQKQEKKLNNNVPMLTMTNEKQSGFIRVKSPAALNDMVKKDKVKKVDKHVKEKRVESPLHVDTSYQPNKKDPSPKHKEEIPQKQIETMRIAENNIPRPALVPVHHSPTFAKPDKRPPEVKKKKEVLIISDVDPLSDQQEPLAIDDSSSDVELIEESRTDKSEPKRDKNETVPSKDHVSVDKKVNNKCRKEKELRPSESEEATKEDIDTVIKNLKEMANSQETTKFNSNSYGGVITSAKYEKSSSQSSLRGTVFESRDKDKLLMHFTKS